MNLLIFGSRAIEIESTKEIMRAYIEKLNPEKIITAFDPDGVCSLAQEISKELCIPLTLHFLDPKRNQGMYHHRSVAATKDCDMAVFFYNGISKGTANEIEVAKKLGKKIEIIKVKVDEKVEGLTDILKEMMQDINKPN